MTSRPGICVAIRVPRSSWPNPPTPCGAWSSARRPGSCAAGDLAGAIRIATRYVGPEKGDEYVREAGYDSVIGRLEPGHLRIWDFDDE